MAAAHHLEPDTRHPPPDFVIVGNVARDVVPGGWRPGGTAIYAAAAASGLGRRVGLVTAATADVAAALPKNVQAVCHAAVESTSFENVYTGDGRVQYLRAAGAAIPPAAIPAAWADTPIALLGPVFHEVDARMAASFRGRVGVCAQGFLRRAAADGRVQPIHPADWDAGTLLDHARALFLSEEDLGPGGGNALAAWVRRTPLVVVTDGRQGARLFRGGVEQYVPAYPAREVDPTGAGDAFAAGFLVALDEGADPWVAACFGAATASVVVEAVGAVAPDRQVVEARVRRMIGAAADATRDR